MGDEFQGKDGVKYREILVPNQDKEDHRPWQTFVVKSNHVHENQFGKGMWCKLPANGSTTLHRSVKVGQDEQGKPIYQDVCYPVTKDFRERLYKEIISEYEKAKDKSNEKARESAEKHHGNPDKEKDKEATPFR